MIDEETMDKSKVIASLFYGIDEIEWAKDFIANRDVSTHLAFGVDNYLITELSDRGVQAISDCFDVLVEISGLEPHQLVALADSVE
jgi:hypothetical protein